MSSKHTPGPWDVHCGDTMWDYSIWSPGTETVVCTVDSNGQSAAECEANAMLIAAAPELLAALEGVMRCFAYAPGSKAEPEWYATVRTAIAKARGHSS